jgi:hypothetical protein
MSARETPNTRVVDLVVRPPAGFSASDAGAAVAAAFALFQGLELAVRGMEQLGNLIDRRRSRERLAEVIELDPEPVDRVAVLEARIAELEEERSHV